MSSVQISQYRDGTQQVFINGHKVDCHVKKVQPGYGNEDFSMPASVTLVFEPERVEYFYDESPREGR